MLESPFSMVVLQVLKTVNRKVPQLAVASRHLFKPVQEVDNIRWLPRRGF